MIELYSAATPNGQKIHIMLEETGLDYAVHWIDIGRGEQFEPKFLEFSPNNKIPAIIDREAPGGAPFAVFESGAILIYLAEKTGRFLPTEALARSTVLQWLMFQMGSVGPMLGQAHHFRAYTRDKIAYAIERYTNEAGRIYNILDMRLADHEFLAGDYSIADMATFPWIRLHQRQGQDLGEFASLRRWFVAIARRPAVAKDMEKLEDVVGEIDDQTWSNLWGAEQYKRR
jgi:GST-like protein